MPHRRLSARSASSRSASSRAVALRVIAPILTAALVLGGAAQLTGPVAAAPYDEGLSHPKEDSYYPAKGEPVVDTLHYDLSLTWSRSAHVLRGDATITLRATAVSDHIQLDLSHAMTVRHVEVDGVPASYTHPKNHLVIRSAVSQDQRHVVRVVYRGTPRPAHGPASRSDVARIGMRVTRSGELWTMQEPFGAFTWYPVNDQPSDKAMYDVRVDVPRGWVGVSTGRMTDRTTSGVRTVTSWTNADPMSSYLMTLAVGPYRRYTDTGPHGLRLTYWVPREHPEFARALRHTPRDLAWLESRLGPYPFDRAGAVLVPSNSAMETQTLVTMGRTFYEFDAGLAREIMVHELAHQWYGDTVTPRDWRDVWMNEGMAMYQESAWAVDQGHTTWRQVRRRWVNSDQRLRDDYGPPGAFHRNEFASANVYYCPALMYDRLRARIGRVAFDRLVREWPQQHQESNQSRRSFIAFAEASTGEELSDFFHDWLMSKRSPA